MRWGVLQGPLMPATEIETGEASSRRPACLFLGRGLIGQIGKRHNKAGAWPILPRHLKTSTSALQFCTFPFDIQSFIQLTSNFFSLHHVCMH